MFARSKLKRQDFLFQSGWFQCLTRSPAELHLQQFQISDCQQCQIYLFDAAACVYIDQCKYCTIFVGACQASIFVRDCQNVIVIGTTQQFRVRDCVQCHFGIFCQSQPIIESSRGITIGNFLEIGYKELREQMEKVKTNPWNNNWFDVYDFTPHKFKMQNYHLADLKDQQKQDILKDIKKKMKQIGVLESQPIIPRIMGKGQYTVEQFSVLVAFPVPETIAEEKYELLQGRVHKICQEEIKNLRLNIPCIEKHFKVLFVKVLRKDASKWKKVLKNIVKHVEDTSLLELYENTVFAPFKDEH